MMSIRELSRECMLRLSYILERSWKKTHRCQRGGVGRGGEGRKHSTHVAGDGLIPHVSGARLRFGSEVIKPLKRGYLA